jgi:hypothetical protein
MLYIAYYYTAHMLYISYYYTPHATYCTTTYYILHYYILLILQAGAHVDAKDYLRRTPLLLAAIAGDMIP